MTAQRPALASSPSLPRCVHASRPLARARVGEEVACLGRVVAKGVVPTRRGLRIFRAVLRDASGVLECVMAGAGVPRPHDPGSGQTLLVAGPVRFYHGRQLAPREYLILADEDERTIAPETGRVLPVYPATEGLSHKVIRALIERHLDALLRAGRRMSFPPRSAPSWALPALPDALRAVHRPATAGGGGGGPAAARLR